MSMEMDPRAGSYDGLIRARRGTSPQAVAAAVSAAGRVIDEQGFKNRGLRLYPVGLKHDLVAPVEPALFVLGAAGLVLALMLMLNLASVLLARAAQREHEFAVSRALGANHLAIMRASLLEGGTLGALGGTLGTVAAVWGTRSLVALAPLDLPRRDEIAIDWRIAAVVVLMGLGLGLLAAAVPAVWAARASLTSLLSSSAVRGGGARGQLRRSLVVVQIALSLILLCSGGLVMRSFERLLRVDPGFRPEGVFTVLVRTPPEFFPRIRDVNAFQERVQAALAAIPGVRSASAASALPLSATTQQMTIRIPNAPGNSGIVERDEALVDVIGTRPDYVETLGMRVIAGRAFEAAHRPDVLEAMIDRTLAEHFFAGENALGATIPIGGRNVTVVGVVDQARLYDLHQDGRGQLYLRAEDWGYRPMFYVIRTDREPSSIFPDVRTAVRRVDPRVAVGNARSMEQIVTDALRQQRTSATLITAFAIGALLLAAMGLFGVVAGSVIRRRHELAVRLALGADHRRVLRLVLGEGALLVGTGLLIAVPGLYMSGRVVGRLLIGVTPWDPMTLVSVALGLATVTMTTCYLPARRVLAIDPARLLREE
jgi:putative ABC transport system permease protein